MWESVHVPHIERWVVEESKCEWEINNHFSIIEQKNWGKACGVDMWETRNSNRKREENKYKIATRCDYGSNKYIYFFNNPQCELYDGDLEWHIYSQMMAAFSHIKWGKIYSFITSVQMCTYKMSFSSLLFSIYMLQAHLHPIPHTSLFENVLLCWCQYRFISPRQYPRNVHLFCIDFSFYFHTELHTLAFYFSLQHCIKNEKKI